MERGKHTLKQLKDRVNCTCQRFSVKANHISKKDHDMKSGCYDLDDWKIRGGTMYMADIATIAVYVFS